MKIRTKLTLGVGLLFVMIVLLTFIDAKYINAIKNDTENILVANYNTLEYARNMLLALDEISDTKKIDGKFEDYLKKQRQNVTEDGEQEITNELTTHFYQLKSNLLDSKIYPVLRNDISQIMRLNMEAIQRKNEIAKRTALSATIWIALSGTICFLIAFTLLINLPNSIAAPIKELSDRIKQIAAINYNQRVHFESHDEFGELAKSFNMMAKKLEEYHDSNLHQLMFEKKRIETLINNMRDPVIGLDEDNKILFINDEASKAIGLQSEELIGKFAHDIAVTNDLMNVLTHELTNSLGKIGKELNRTIKIYADNKESFFEKEIIDIQITPTGEKDIKHIGHVILLKNVTPFKEMDDAKTNFIATVSHELKTPISSIKKNIQSLEKKKTGVINEAQKKLIESIKEDSSRLLKITSELLNLSQVETGNIQLNIQQNSPHEILEYVLEAIQVQADQKRIVLITDVDKDLPEIKTDIEKTAWVLVNFLTNAIRYSSEQSKILIQVKRDQENILFSVKDQGKGIGKRYLSKIFDKYLQIPGSNKTGTCIGLGLAISKEFIEAQGGSIGVTSEVGVGSTFYFRLSV